MNGQSRKVRTLGLAPVHLQPLNMKTIFLFIAASLVIIAATAQSGNDKKQIIEILNQQTLYWNKGNLEEFMSGYWQSDSLMFIGKNGVTYGYANTLANYKKSYNGPEQMGKLFFDIIKVQKLSSDYYWVLGKWMLKRTVGDLSGHYTLLFRKIAGKWKIVADHSS